MKWNYSIASAYFTSPSIGMDGSTIYVFCNTYLYALNLNGTLKWRFSTGAQYASPISIGIDGTLYIGCYEKGTYAVNPNGTLKWKFSTGRQFATSPAIDLDGTIYVFDAFTLYALNPNGTVKWSYLITNSSYHYPSIGLGGAILFACGDHYLYALNPDGTLEWRLTIASMPNRPVAIDSDGTSYFSYFDSTPNVGDWIWSLVAVNPNGTQKWIFKGDNQNAGSATATSPAVGSDGTIYFTENASGNSNTSGYLHAVNPDGTWQWSIQTGSSGSYGATISSATIGHDGTIYFTFSDGYLYAVASSSMGPANSPWPMVRHDAKHTGSVGGSSY